MGTATSDLTLTSADVGNLQSPDHRGGNCNLCALWRETRWSRPSIPGSPGWELQRPRNSGSHDHDHECPSIPGSPGWELQLVADYIHRVEGSDLQSPDHRGGNCNSASISSTMTEINLQSPDHRGGNCNCERHADGDTGYHPSIPGSPGWELQQCHKTGHLRLLHPSIPGSPGRELQLAFAPASMPLFVNPFNPRITGVGTATVGRGGPRILVDLPSIPGSPGWELQRNNRRCIVRVAEPSIPGSPGWELQLEQRGVNADQFQSFNPRITGVGTATRHGLFDLAPV